MYVAPLTPATPDLVTTSVGVVHAGAVRRVGSIIIVKLREREGQGVDSGSHSKVIYRL